MLIWLARAFHAKPALSSQNGKAYFRLRPHAKTARPLPTIGTSPPCYRPRNYTFAMATKKGSDKVESKTKKFGKGERSVPHHTQKARKFYPAQDEARPRKVCGIWEHCYINVAKSTHELIRPIRSFCLQPKYPDACFRLWDI